MRVLVLVMLFTARASANDPGAGACPCVTKDSPWFQARMTMLREIVEGNPREEPAKANSAARERPGDAKSPSMVNRMADEERH